MSDQQGLAPQTDDEFPYVYFVAYAQAAPGRLVGFGNHAVSTRRPVTTFEEIQQLGRTIEAASGFPANTVAILNYPLISGPTEDPA